MELSKMKHFEIDGISFWFDKEENKYAMDMSKKRVEIVSMKNFGRLPKTHWEEDSVRHYISIRVTGYLLMIRGEKKTDCRRYIKKPLSYNA